MQKKFKINAKKLTLPYLQHSAKQQQKLQIPSCLLALRLVFKLTCCHEAKAFGIETFGSQQALMH